MGQNPPALPIPIILLFGNSPSNGTSPFPIGNQQMADFPSISSLIQVKLCRTPVYMMHLTKHFESMACRRFSMIFPCFSILHLHGFDNKRWEPTNIPSSRRWRPWRSTTAPEDHRGARSSMRSGILHDPPMGSLRKTHWAIHRPGSSWIILDHSSS